MVDDLPTGKATPQMLDLKDSRFGIRIGITYKQGSTAISVPPALDAAATQPFSLTQILRGRVPLSSALVSKAAARTNSNSNSRPRVRAVQTTAAPEYLRNLRADIRCKTISNMNGT